MRIVFLFITLLSSFALWASEVINVNSASQKELETLNGVGPVIAERIVQYRESHGSFSTVDELQKVKGISAAWVEKNKTILASQ
ncbi:ComEA family DNA-binding protein [Litoribrevibacter euphylliae]|uniref:ComEA family DNA-binding protein n=1 Tax=Litoribrevibacter euphylliae TaxID=1834034 RepID=A0ABV7HBD5_9GAMM